MLEHPLFVKIPIIFDIKPIIIPLIKFFLPVLNPSLNSET